MKKKVVDDEGPSGLCILCGKPPKPTERVDSRKDFVCSHCVLWLVEHPRSIGERIEDTLNTERHSEPVPETE